MHNIHHFTVSLTYETDKPDSVSQVLNVHGDTSIPWLTSLADVFGQRTPSYDGYISSVKVDIAKQSINIDSYIIEDNAKLKNVRESCNDVKPFISEAVGKAFLIRASSMSELQNVSVSCSPKD